MARLIWTLEARGWLREIHEYISRESVDAAYKVVRGILERTRMFLDFPEMGHLYQPARSPEYASSFSATIGFSI